MLLQMLSRCGKNSESTLKALIGFRRIVWFVCITSTLLSGCATEPAPVLPTMEELAEQKSHQLNITNLTDEVINAILFKPCGKDTNGFYTLAENLKPKQKVAFSMHDACIHIKAMNAFDQVLAEMDALTLSDVNHWDIQRHQAEATTENEAAKKTQ